MIKEIIEKRTGLKLRDIPKKVNQYGGHEVGKKYYCGYWDRVYEVLEIKADDIFGWSVVCKWDDGSVNKHSTSLWHKKDFEVVTEIKTKRCNQCLECDNFCNGCDGNTEPCEAFEYTK